MESIVTNSWKKEEIVEVSKIIMDFLDVATTSYGRATHYNTKEEQRAAENKVHKILFDSCRDLYTILLLAPGATDRSRQLGIRRLLSSPQNGQGLILNPKAEKEVLRYLIDQLSPPRMLKLFSSLGEESSSFGNKKINNSRTRKLVLNAILGSPKLELWSVKYRKRIKGILTHVWGQRTCSIIGSILRKSKSKRTVKETRIVGTYIGKYARNEYTEDCVAFILGSSKRYKLALHKAFNAAKTDLKKGSILPTEILEGIRSQYHPDVPKESILEMKAEGKSLTTHEQRTVQKRAKAAGITVEMNPHRYDPVDLYIYAFENGADADLISALDQKAEKNAAMLPMRYENLGIIVDASASMYGSDTQPLRPLAVSLSLRDTLQKASDRFRTVYCGGAYDGNSVGTGGRLIQPSGDTGLAWALLKVMEDKPEAVCVISDGYENAPAGRFSDVLIALREIGVTIPVYHLNPVFAAESGSVRALCEWVDGFSTMPVRSPSDIVTTVLRGLLESDPERGINLLVERTLASCGSTKILKLIGGE